MLKHGHCAKKLSPTYRCWLNLKQRCMNTKSTKFSDYGGRGIQVCDRWLDFENFLEDMGEKPKDLTLDRENNDGDYCPENCRWVTDKEQRRNKRSVKLLEFAGQTLCLTDWAALLGFKQPTLWKRLYVSKWSIEKVLTTPVRKGR